MAAILAFRYVPTVAWLLTLAPPAIASLNGAMLVDPPNNLAFEGIGPLVAALFVTSAASRPLGRGPALGAATSLSRAIERARSRSAQGPAGLSLATAVGARLGAEDRPPREVEMASYRVCQAALDNPLIHARPTSIRVRLEVDAAHARLEVADDGVGIRPGDEDRAIRGGHLGLVDMRSRAAAIGAALQVGRHPGGGTLALLRWPA